MKFLVPTGGGGRTDDIYGTLTSPAHHGIPANIMAGRPWAGDLGVLSGPGFVKKIDMAVVLPWIESMTPHRATCLFLAGGDVVGDATETLAAYYDFEASLPGWPLAYVAQDGAENLPIPDSCAAVFIGGSTEWKESMAAVGVIKRAQATGRHIHIGRVNWGRRYRMFAVLAGSDKFTCDGTRTRFDGREKTLKAWRDYEAQRTLIEL